MTKTPAKVTLEMFLYGDIVEAIKINDIPNLVKLLRTTTQPLPVDLVHELADCFDPDSNGKKTGPKPRNKHKSKLFADREVRHYRDLCRGPEFDKFGCDKIQDDICKMYDVSKRRFDDLLAASNKEIFENYKRCCEDKLMSKEEAVRFICGWHDILPEELNKIDTRYARKI